MVSSMYNTTSERLWEKIEFHRDAFDPLSAHGKQAGIEMMKMYNDKNGTDLEPRE